MLNLLSRGGTRLGRLAMTLVFAGLLLSCGGRDGEPPPAVLPATVQILAPASLETAQASSLSVRLAQGLETQWDFGDGTAQVNAGVGSGDGNVVVQHLWTMPGDYTVVLTVSNGTAEKREFRHRVTVGSFSLVRNAACSNGPERGWCWQHPRPNGNAFAAVFFVNAALGWAVGDAGQIMHTRDGGQSWTAQFSGVNKPLTQVGFADALNGWAVGEAITLHTSNGGTTWELQAPATGGVGYMGTLHVIDAQRAVLLTGPETPIATADGGQTWTAGEFLVKAVTPAGTLWYRRYADIAKSTDLGRTLTSALPLPTSRVDVRSIHFTTPNHGWMFGWAYDNDQRNGTTRATLWTTADAGMNWTSTEVSSGAPSQALVHSMFADGSGWMAEGETLRRTRDNGISWTPVPLARPAVYGLNGTSTQSTDGNTLWYLGRDGFELTRDGGLTWTLLLVAREAQSGQTPRRLQIAPNGSLWLHYGAGTLYRSTDNGQTWALALGASPADVQADLKALALFGPRKAMALGIDGMALDTLDGGLTWARRDLHFGFQYGGRPLRLQSANATTGWAILSGESIYRTHDGGATWLSPIEAPTFNQLMDVRFVNALIGFAVQADGSLFRSDDGGMRWRLLTRLPQSGEGLAFADSSFGIAVSSSGLISRTTDGGATWSLRPTGEITPLVRAVFSDATTAWAVGDGGMLLRSDNAGLAWVRVPLSTGAYLRDIVFADPQHGWIVGQGGAVLATTDGGRTWIQQVSGTRKDLHAVAAVDARTVWIVGEQGSVLVSATGGN